MKRSKVITMKNGELSIIRCKTGIFYKNKAIDYKNSVIDSKVSLKNSRVKLVIEGEEIFTYSIVTPRVRKEKLYLIIRNELINKFHSIENLIFDYKIYEKGKTDLKIMIYCVNVSNLYLLDQEVFKNSIIKSIDVIQQKYVDYNIKVLKKYFKALRGYDKTLNHKEFILVAKKAEYIYIVKVEEGILVSNRVILFNNNKLYEEIVRFLKEVSHGEEIKRIYIFMKVDYEDIKISRIDEIEKYLLESRFLVEEASENEENKEIACETVMDI